MAEIKIQLKATGRGVLSNARRLAALRSADKYPNTAAAVKKLTKEAQSVMLRAVQGKAVSWTGGQFTIRRVSGQLHGSILGGLRYPYEGNPLRGAIEVKIKHYKWIKEGVRSYDMKAQLLASPKAKISKKGIKYVVVPIPIDPGNRFSARIFRIVTANSKGWIHPGTPPRRLDLYTQEVMKKRSSRVLREALKKDLASP